MIKTLQRIYRLVILGALGMAGYGNQQWYYQLIENFDAHYSCKKSNLSLTSFLKYCKIVPTCYYWHFGHVRFTHQKQQYQLVGNLDVYLHAKSLPISSGLS